MHQTFGVRSSVERFFGYLKDRTRVFYNNINPKKTLFAPLVNFLEHALVHAVEVTRVNAYPDTILPLMVPGLGGGERSIQAQETIIRTPSHKDRKV